MAKKKTALQRVRSNPRNVTAKDLITLLEQHGFKLRNVSGDHYIYKKDGFRPMPVPYCQNPVSIRIVKEILELIDLIEEQKQQ